ncbi:hypothetical protein OB2597_03879, partial [Pseudooceanicola batsensis HTCC2597]
MPIPLAATQASAADVRMLQRKTPRNKFITNPQVQMLPGKMNARLKQFRGMGCRAGCSDL